MCSFMEREHTPAHAITSNGNVRKSCERHSWHPAGTVVTAIPDQRVLVYQLTPNSASLEFAGLVFYRKATCAAE